MGIFILVAGIFSLFLKAFHAELSNFQILFTRLYYHACHKTQCILRHRSNMRISLMTRGFLLYVDLKVTSEYC